MVSSIDIAPPFTRDRMQKIKTARKGVNPLLIVGAVVILALVGAGAVRNAREQAIARNWTQVVAVSRDLPAGTRIGIANLRFIDVPRQYVTPDMVKSPVDVVG